MRMRGLAVAAMMAAMPFVPAGAQTGDYPFTGFFADAGVDEDAEVTAQRCALAFFEQRADGSYSYYHLDRKAFEAGHKLAYLQYAKGHCTFDPGRKIEICNSLADLGSRDDQTYTAVAVFSDMSPDIVSYSSYDSIAEAKAAIASGEEADAEDQGEYRRCPTAPAKLKSLIQPGMTTYSEDDIGALSDPEDDMLSGTMTAGVVKALAGK